MLILQQTLRKYRFILVFCVALVAVQILFVGVVLSPSLALAEHATGHTTPPPPDPTETGPTPKLTNPLKTDSLEEFIVAALVVVRNIGFVVAVFFIVYAGFLFVTARGSDDKLKTAKNALLGAVVGTAVILGAWVFAEAIRGTVGQISL